jgi:outer membrane immunogenic protein
MSMKVALAVFATVSALLFGWCPSSARADGYSQPGVYVPQPFASWTGFYIGGQIGGAWQDVDWANVSLTNERVNNDASGFIGGGQIGYNRQFGNIVLGVEATLSGATLSDDYRSVVNPVVTYRTDIDAIATATARLGLAHDGWLFYGKGGWAGAQVNVSGRDPALPDSFSQDEWRNGWTLGTGLEYKLRRNISVGIEYDFIDLGSRNFTGTTAFGLPYTITDHDVQVQSVMARLNFQFGRDEYAPLK